MVAEIFDYVWTLSMEIFLLNSRGFALLVATLMLAAAHAAEGVRIKDLGRLSGWRENALVGYGLVTGLAGTGDSVRSKATRQSIANMLGRFDVNVLADDIQGRNVAAVMIAANLPPFARPGELIDVTVTSIADARSLVGGALLLAPLKAPDGRVYALAQGPVTVGGYKYDLNGNVVQKNHPTVASVPGGGIVEIGLEPGAQSGVRSLTFILANPDYTTATRVAAAINGKLGSDSARARDASGIEIDVPDRHQHQIAEFISMLEHVQVQPDYRAIVVINERTGTVVAGGDVRISQVAISHGDLRVTVTTENQVSQPIAVYGDGANVRSQIYSNTKLSVDEKVEGGFYMAQSSSTVSDLVQGLTKLRTNTRDIISILRAIKAAGALRADLIVQ